MNIGTLMGQEICPILGQVSHNLLYLTKKLDGYTWSGGRLTRKQLTSRPDHLWPELWKSLGKNAKLKEKQKWSEEKIHLENARKLRGIYFIDPEDTEFKETIKNARKKLETSVASALLCKISNKIKSKLACFLEASESTRPRTGESVPNHHENHVAGKGDNSQQHYNLVHKFIPMPQAMKILAAKAVDTLPGQHTSLDVMLEKHIEDFWNVDGEKELSDAWTGFTRFILLNERPLDGYTRPGRRLTRKQTTSRPYKLWPGMWKHMSDAAKKKAKRRCAIDKPKFDNARKLRGIFCIEPEDEKFQHTMKNSGRKLEIRCQQRCLVQHQQIAAGKLAPILGNTSPNMLVLSMPTNL